MNNQTKIQNLLDKIQKITGIKILSFETINFSFTNKILKLCDENGKFWKLRISNSSNKFINRELEKEIETTLHNNQILYYDDDYNFIKKWFDGHNLKASEINDVILGNILIQIENLHNLKIKNSFISKPIFYDDIDIDLELMHPLSLYKKIVNSFNSNDFVLSHNDCSCANLLVNKNDVMLIDFEWASYNHKLWDICNLIKDLEYNLVDIKKIKFINDNLKEYVSIIYATHFYTYFWTIRVESTKKVLEYRKHIKNRLLYWYKVLTNEF